MEPKTDAAKDPVTVAIGQTIRRLRDDAGLSQATLAQAVRERGLPSMRQPALARIEKGERRLQFEEAMAMADVLGARLDDLRPDNVREAHEIKRLASEIAEAEEALMHALAELQADAEDLALALESPAAELLDPALVTRWKRRASEATIDNVARSAKELHPLHRSTRDIDGPVVSEMLLEADRGTSTP